MSPSFLRFPQQTKVQCHQSSPWSTSELMERLQSINEGSLIGESSALCSPKGSWRAFLLNRVDDFPIVEQPLLSPSPPVYIFLRP